MKKKSSPASENPNQSLSLGRLAELAAEPFAFALFGLLIAWSFLQPLDSTAVFQGDALGQNFGWIFLALLVATLGWSQPLYQRVGNRELTVLCGLALWLVVVTVRAGEYCNPRTGWNGFWHVTALLCFYYSARCLLWNANNRSMTVLVLLSGGVVLSVISLHQVLVDFPEQRALYFQDPDRILSELELDAPAGSPQRLRYEARLNSPEPFATFALTNSLAVLLSGLVILTAGSALRILLSWRDQNSSQEPQAVYGKRNKSGLQKKERKTTGLPETSGRRLWQLLPLLTVGGLIACVLILTRSRAAYIAVLLSGLGLVVNIILEDIKSRSTRVPLTWSRRRVTTWLAGMAVLSFSVLILLWWFDRSLFTGAINSFSFRRDYWIATVRMIQDHWLLGVGLGNFQSYYPQYMLPTASETIADPHNWPLDLAVNCSLPFAVVVVLGFLRLITFGFPTRKTTDDGATPSPMKSSVVIAIPAKERWIALGAGLGGLLVAFAMWLFGLNLLLVFIALCLAGVLAIPIWPLVSSVLSDDSIIVRWVVLAMSVCLLISGSWQAAGLIIPLLCLVACSTGNFDFDNTATRKDSLDQVVDRASFSPGRKRGGIVLGAVAALLVAFGSLGWNPVLRSDLVGMSPQTDLRLQIEATKQARELDPLDCKWDRFLVTLLTQAAVKATDRQTFVELCGEATDEIENWVKREPTSFLTWQTAGNRTLDLAAAAERLELPIEDLLTVAANYAVEAVRAFPTSVQLRVQSAYCLLLIGEKAKAEAEMVTALELDRATPHSDRKLSAQVVWIPEFRDQPKYFVGSRDQWSPAEPLVNWLRKQL